MRRLLWLGLLPVLGFALPSRTQQKATFSQDIRPILAAKCVTCHSDSGMGPFQLQTYGQVRKRGDLVRQVALTGQMPPTDARSDFGSLTMCPPLDSKELLVIQEWYRLGMPKGQDTPPIASKDVWGAPNQKLEQIDEEVGRGQSIPAEGQSARIVYPIDSLAGMALDFTDFKFTPRAPKAVRQVVLAVQRAGQPVPFTSGGIRPNVPLATWSQGFNDARGRGSILVGEKDRLWVQIRAVPTGKVESAAGTLSITTIDSPKASQKTLGNNTFQVPADSQVILRDEWTLDEDIDLISALPEARFTTEQVKLSAKTGDEVKTVMMVLTWDPVWPGAYNFIKPVRLKKGTTLIYEAMINNSKHGHAAEEEKPKAVKYGPKPQDELFWCHLAYVPAKP